MALPMAFVACTNEEFEENSISEVQKGELVELPENYLLSGVMGNNSSTRSIYNGTSFAWLPFGDNTPDAIGLCWRGGTYASNGSVVYTNYKFDHYGWLGKGEEKAVLDCDGHLENGRLLGDLVNNEADLLKGTWPVYNSAKYPDLKVDAKNGLFNTCNTTIFKGDYIVYYPYNDKFNEVGYIPATAPSNIKRDVNGLTEENYTKELAKEIFVAGTMNGVEGGQQNGVFSTNFVSGGIVVKITADNSDLKIHKVVLLSDNGFATKVNLDASKIAAGATGANLYAAEPTEFANTLVAEFYNSANNKQDNLEITSGKTNSVAFAALPTTASTALKNAKVILVDENEKSYLADAQLTEVKSLASGEWNVIKVKAKAVDFKDVAYAYDTESLINLLVKHSGTTGKGQTINVLNKITLDPSYTFTLPYGGDTEGRLDKKFIGSERSIYIAENLTLTGKGSIVVPADLQLVFKSVGTAQKPATVAFNIPVTIENKGCCGNYNGTVVLRTASDGFGKYTFTKIENEGTLYLGNDLNGKVDITVDELNNNGGLINSYCINKNNDKPGSTINIKKLTNTFVTRDTETDEEKANNGRINVVAKFWNPETGEKEVAVQGKKLCVNMTVGELNNGENAYVLVGKRAYFGIEGAATNAGKIKVETASVNNNSEDAQMYIARSGAVSNSGLIENFGVINNEGSLKNSSADGDIVDHVGCQFGGNKAVALPGEYICDVEDEDVTSEGDRVGYAMGANMPTTTIRFVGNGATKNENGKYVYNLAGYKANNVLPYNFIIAAETPVVLKGFDGKKVTNVTIDGTLAVESKLDLSQIMLTVNKEVTVDAALAVNTTNPSAATTENVDAFTAKSNVTVNDEFTVANFARTNMDGNFIINKDGAATFNYATYTDIANVLNINGTFTRVVSTGGNTANPAQVWCASYTKGSNAVIPNGLPQVR